MKATTLTRWLGATGRTASVAPAGAGLAVAVVATLIWAWAVMPNEASTTTAAATRVICICMEELLEAKVSMCLKQRAQGTRSCPGIANGPLAQAALRRARAETPAIRPRAASARLSAPGVGT